MQPLNILFGLILLIYSIRNGNCEDDYKYTYHRMEIINGSDEFFKYSFEVKKQENSDSVFVVNADLEQLVPLDNNWKSHVTVFRSDDGESEYRQFLKLPKVGVCSFMSTIYKQHFYEKIKDYSNLPHYEACPLQQAKYYIKEYPFDANSFKQIAKPGFYRIDAYLVDGDVAKTGIQVYGSVA